MTQTERRQLLLRALLDEQPRWRGVGVPADEDGQKALLRALLNVRPPAPLAPAVLAVQDAYLKAETAARGITDAAELAPIAPGICLWQGDITTLRVDAIVNAANSGMTGCYIPNHRCIDNCIHTFAGAQLRWDCALQMAAQGHEEPVGQARLTPGYDLPCRYILHTVGPATDGRPTAAQRRQLADCYRACLELAAQHDLRSVAFCCISTGEFRFPHEDAAQIAVDTVRACQRRAGGKIKVIFNVFLDLDRDIYQRLLTG